MTHPREFPVQPSLGLVTSSVLVVQKSRGPRRRLGLTVRSVWCPRVRSVKEFLDPDILDHLLDHVGLRELGFESLERKKNRTYKSGGDVIPKKDASIPWIGNFKSY